jgi:hypothetical protein
MRLKLRFFKSRCTDLNDKESTICNSTLLSAISLKVHLAQPAGASLHANAIIRASTSPVILGSIGGLSRFFLCKNALTFSAATKSFFTTVIVVTLTASRLEISSNAAAFPFLGVSSSRIISARLISFAL